jgi:cyclopropane-fatty-acyl-phospholipid synthase
MLSTLLSLAERNRLPDSVIRLGIRRLLAARLRSLPAEGSEAAQEALRRFVSDCDAAPIAAVPERANEQHYEVPAEFFRHVLGPRLKYSGCYWSPDCTELAAAEEAALACTCARAQLVDGQTILELGCGWGSLTLWMADRFPRSHITAVSNSNSQREFITGRARERGLTNVTVITADMNEFSPAACDAPFSQFDRVVSVEMFEHMRNHRRLLANIAAWLNSGGKLFVHIFCRRSRPYLFTESGPSDWMTRYFFAGGMMPSDALLLRYQEALAIEDHWHWSGRHYERTANAWLANMDARAAEITPQLQEAYGAASEVWRQRWRMFFMACAELFAYRDGREWFVAHFLFRKPDR